MACWLVLYVPICWLWLRDVTSTKVRILPVQVGKLGQPYWTPLISIAYGVVCGVPSLLFADLWAPPARAFFSTVAVFGCVAASAISLKKPGGSLWFARATLVTTATGWVAGDGSKPAQVFILLAGGLLFSEILSRRSIYLRRKFQEAATERANALLAVHDKSRELQDLTSSRIRILATVSHEIRQPVHALGMMVERLRVDPHATEFRGQIDEVAAVVRSLAHSLALLLDISRLEAGTVKVRKSVTSIQTLMERVTREFAIDARRKGLKFECSSDLNVRIETDFALLYGAVANFVSNALRYTDKGHVKVFVTARGSDQIWLHVADTGRGIPSDKLEDIFKEYVRLDRENQSAQGFGLGLAIVKRTAQLLDLDVAVQSELGKGSEFRISVPCTSQSQSTPLSSTKMARPTTVTRSLVGLRVILVDNDESVLRGIDSMVRSWGCVPLSCQSVAELGSKLEHMAGIEFDCIVADFHLGTGAPNGLDAIELVRSKSPGFIAATLFTGDLNVRSADLRVADVHVAHKPVVPARISMVFEEMAAETKRRRSGAPHGIDKDGSGLDFDEESMSDHMPLASTYSFSNSLPVAMLPVPEEC
jgi:signal transduction histidine kinase